MRHLVAHNLPYYEEIDTPPLHRLIEVLDFKKDLIVLASTLRTKEEGRYSFVCFDSFASFNAKGKKFFWNDEPVTLSDPFSFLKEKINEYSLIPNEDLLPSFQGGVAGYFAYEASHYLEELPRVNDPIGLPDIYLNFYSTVIAIDHELKRSWIIATGFPEKNEKARLRKAKETVVQIKKLLADRLLDLTLGKSESVKITSPMLSNFDQPEYIHVIEKTKQYIKNGDIFQANISQQFCSTLNEDAHALTLYMSLMYSNPSPFSSFIKIMNQGYIVSASPERFIKFFNQEVTTSPIKGTAPRSKDAAEDRRLAKALLNSEKDRSENIMIVDLMRNDLSKVCLPNSVQVEELCALKSFPSVHHLVSKIGGRVKDEYAALDVLRVCFPPGSITGAPKIRAMEIISELEQRTRGPYCGSVGYISFTGAMDMSVTIRAYYIKDKKIFLSAGGATVLDSDPCGEYLESLTKAKALLDTLTL